MSSLPVALLRGSAGFACDPRYATAVRSDRTTPEPNVDPLAEAYERGYAEGTAQALEAALDAERERDAQRGVIELAFARLDERSKVDLGERLRQTVLALCEEAIMPMALDGDSLAARIDKATSLLQRSHDERRILLNPEDLELVRKRLPAGLAVEAESSVERGGIRIETPDGGVEDGPTQWRRALAEAFREC